MDVKDFVNSFREAFGSNAKLPLAFWYSEKPVAEPQRVNGCFFKAFGQLYDGTPMSFDVETIGCGGGKLYTGFIPMPPTVPAFVSGKEKYKQTPEMVTEFIDRLGIPDESGRYLNFTRIDNVQDFGTAEGLIFVASPDVLSGLLTWAWFDTNAEDAVATIFGSGCSATVTQAALENRRGGYRTFLGGFDTSVRPHFAPDELTFTIPMSRFRVMLGTMRRSCLYDTHAWHKVQGRLP